MRLIKQTHSILTPITNGIDILKFIEFCGRTCYKSEDKISQDSAIGFVDRILKTGHHSVIEHFNITTKVITDRGITHELVRHRLAAFSQESTRYAQYSKDKFENQCTFIIPVGFDVPEGNYKLEYPSGKMKIIFDGPINLDDIELPNDQKAWLYGIAFSEMSYLSMIRNGSKAQIARGVLPNSLKAELVITANIREWRHIFNLRCDAPAHPQIRHLMLPILKEFHKNIPVLFDDLYTKYFKEEEQSVKEENNEEKEKVVVEETKGKRVVELNMKI